MEKPQATAAEEPIDGALAATLQHKEEPPSRLALKKHSFVLVRRSVVTGCRPAASGNHPYIAPANEGRKPGR